MAFTCGRQWIETYVHSSFCIDLCVVSEHYVYAYDMKQGGSGAIIILCMCRFT